MRMSAPPRYMSHAEIGVVRCRLGCRQDCVAGGNRHGYAGYEFEAVTAYAFWHVRHRSLNSDLARWSTRDPKGYDDGPSRYAYARSSPIRLVDAWGTQSIVATDHCASKILESCAAVASAALAYVNQRCAESSCCPTWSIRCDDSLDAQNRGATCCGACEIRLFPQADCSDLIHELIHAGDNCQNGCTSAGAGECGSIAKPGGNFSCELWACTELRAIHYGCCQSTIGYGECLDRLIAGYSLHAECGKRIKCLIPCCLPFIGRCDEPISNFPPPCLQWH